MIHHKLFLSQALGSAVALSAVALGSLSALAQQPPRWTHDVGVSARQPGLGTASLGTDGARFSGRLGEGPVTASASTSGGLNLGAEQCFEAYPIPTQAGRLGARVCGQISPNGLTGTITPGLELPTRTQVGAYYRFNYVPLLDDPAAARVQPQQSATSYASQDDRLMELLRERTAERIRQQQIDNHLAAQIAANAYNPPAEYAGQPPAAAAAPQPEPASAASPQTSSGGLTEDQFRAEMARIHGDFQRADEFNRQNPLNIPIPQENQTPPIGDVPPAGGRPRITYDDYAPRNGYDAQGNRPDSTRRRYDENGNYAAPPQVPHSTAIDGSSQTDFWQTPAPSPQPAPQRQNRVYNPYNNTSRPIGSGRSNIAQQAAAMQQWSNNQIAAMNARRSTPSYQASSVSTGAEIQSSQSNSASSYSPSEASPRATGFGYDETARRGSQIVYDDNAPRAGSTSVLDEAPQRPISSPVYDHRPGESGVVVPGDSPSSPPAIAPREAGQSAATAALRW